MAERGIVGKAQDEIVQGITSFALYGFPESHAASFALLAYASAYLKAHHPTAFLIALLNAWPMGFYHPATLVQDAKRHGVEVRPIDVNRSEWTCVWEEAACRLGLRFVHGLRTDAGRRIPAERAGAGPFERPEDLARRCDLREDELATLAAIGAMGSLGLSRREALWQVGRITRPAGPLFEDEADREPSPLPEMTPFEETAADFRGAGLTAGLHPVAHVRAQLAKQGVVKTADLARFPPGARLRTAGAVIVRQRPGTAKGVLFVTIEDETGTVQAMVAPDLFREHRALVAGAPGLVIEGILERRDGSTSMKAERFWPLPRVQAGESHDFR
jgi:error-prone DNA polymerase